jgi:peptidoglycan/xylan/chitin deacetylase (PgdA/CDA1 family)
MVLVAGGYVVTNSRTFQLAGVLVHRVDTAAKLVALTFDDGPAEHTPEVLDVLARSKIPATFYLNGADLDRYPEHGAAIARTGYRGPVTFRPPYGKKLWTLPRYLAERDRITVTWDVERDSGGKPDTAQIVEDTVGAVQPGSIILLHVMFDGRSASRAAVPQIIERLQADGYQFVTVSDLLEQQVSAANNRVPAVR